MYRLHTSYLLEFERMQAELTNPLAPRVRDNLLNLSMHPLKLRKGGKSTT